MINAINRGMVFFFHNLFHFLYAFIDLRTLVSKNISIPSRIQYHHVKGKIERKHTNNIGQQSDLVHPETKRHLSRVIKICYLVLFS